MLYEDEGREILRQLSYRRAVAHNLSSVNLRKAHDEAVEATLNKVEEREMLRKLSYRRAVAQNVLELLIQDVECEARTLAIRVSDD